MRQNARYVKKWRGYYMEDIECRDCLHYLGKKQGCPFLTCQYADERLDALEHGRISRKRGAMKWEN